MGLVGMGEWDRWGWEDGIIGYERMGSAEMEGWDQRGWEDRVSGNGRIESVGIGTMGSVGMGG